MWSASRSRAIWSRFQRKPGASRSTLRGRRPRRSASATVARMVSSEVFWPRVTSTGSMRCGGLSQWKPTTRSGRSTTAAIAVIDSPDVFVERIVLGLARRDNSLKHDSLSPRSSGIFSETKSAPPTASPKSWLRRTLARAALASCSPRRPAATSSRWFFRIRSCAASRLARLRDSSTTSRPASAQTWAIPVPMIPAPSTAVRMCGPPGPAPVTSAPQAGRPRRRVPRAGGSLERRQHVGLDLIAVGDRVGRVEQPHDRHALAEPLGVEAELENGGGVGVDAVGAAVRGRHGERQHLASERVELRLPADGLGVHDGLQAGPEDLQVVRVCRQDEPEVRYRVEALGRFNIGEDLGYLAGRRLFGDGPDGGVAVL